VSIRIGVESEHPCATIDEKMDFLVRYRVEMAPKRRSETIPSSPRGELSSVAANQQGIRTVGHRSGRERI
jgi:hypothetical protein